MEADQAVTLNRSDFLYKVAQIKCMVHTAPLVPVVLVLRSLQDTSKVH